MLAIGGVCNGSIKDSIFRDRSRLSRLASTTANFFLKGLRSLDKKERAATVNFKIWTIPCRRPIDPYDVPNTQTIVTDEINHLVRLTHSKHLPIFQNVEKKINMRMEFRLLELGLEGRVEEITFYKEV